MLYFSFCALLCVAIGTANHLEHANGSGSANKPNESAPPNDSQHMQRVNDAQQKENTQPAEGTQGPQDTQPTESSESGGNRESAEGEESGNNKEPPRTRIKQGEIIGTYYSTYSGREIPAFYGLPFAAPPVGDLRFAAPQPPRSWDTPYKATNKSDFCVQIFLAAPVASIGNEDCLYLDVYTPKVPKNGQCDKLYDVFYYLHPSGAQITSGIIMEPYYLMDKYDVVFVPANYRLGALGFMSSGDMAIPGNAGLKDQVMGMRWIQENIRAFCGDPNKVTLVGASFGAISIGLHMISPLSKGLFHRVIMVSGTAFLHASFNSATPKLTRTIANQMNCPTDDSYSMAQCMKQKNALTFFDYELQFHPFFLQPLVIFTPVLEPCHEGAYLTKSPYQAYLDGDLVDVEVLFAFNEFEGLIFTYFLSVPGLSEALDLSYRTNLKFLILIERSVSEDKYEEVDELIKQEYFGDGLITGNELAFKEMLTDAVFLFEYYNNSLSLAKLINSPIYNFFSTYRGQYSTSVLLSVIQTEKNYGASHFDLDLYVNFNGLVEKKVRRNKNDTEMIDFMTELFYSFGTTGKPSIAEKIGWHPQPKEGDKLHYLRLDNARDMRIRNDDDNFARYKFWKTLPIETYRGFVSVTCEEQKNYNGEYGKQKSDNRKREEQNNNAEREEQTNNSAKRDKQKNDVAKHQQQINAEHEKQENDDAKRQQQINDEHEKHEKDDAKRQQQKNNALYEQQKQDRAKQAKQKSNDAKH